MDHTKMHQADLGPFLQELYARGLKFVLTLLVCWKLVFCASTGGAIQM